MKILIVEDEPTLVTALADKFTQENFAVVIARNGQEGLDAALKDHPDIVLLDIVMPVMDGMTMLKELRKDEWGKNAQVILLTNLSDAEKMKASIDQDVAGYLIKSDWKLDDLVAKVKEKIAPKV